MDTKNKSQILNLLLITTLLIIAPLLSSSSLRISCLYFVVNLLLIYLGAEAGLLSLPKETTHHEDEQNHSTKNPRLIITTSLQQVADSVPDQKSDQETIIVEEVKKVVDEKCGSEKLKFVGSIINGDKSSSRKCSSSIPNLFFVGGCGDQVAAEEGDEGGFVEEEDKQVGELSGQELFHKAETFIMDFYKQLKMQREESYLE
ncbi:unnamed protein product [Cuscuta epithymum]|uniref:DUF4408 domain-containing protein n=1 Tax=Cuscuta epithymum TaxID=186058 RepID=A0AAV0C491_9ASTE|nr:unnamed protein product [Cuscuta epithymum]